jgi:hypothetical protein
MTKRIPLDVFLLTPEDGNRSSCRNVVFYIYFEFRMMDKVQKLRDSSSEIFGKS